ncbi:MAG: hypothetical protein JXA96_00850 [Sedimentisphaerales bacterium]|nr:hypothetical protein [Sedimentisphaerales bacterium]
MKVLEILNKAEEELRKAIAEAAHSGDYRAVEVGRNVAVNIKEISDRISGNGQLKSKNETVEKEFASVGQKKKKKVIRRIKPTGLPRFEVKNGSLYKIGWSKKRRSEYSHKVPRTAFDAITNAMNKLANEGSGPFMAEKVIEKLNLINDEMIPAYQVYVVMAALRANDVIKQVGREGYNIPTDISENVKNIWNELAN